MHAKICHINTLQFISTMVVFLICSGGGFLSFIESFVNALPIPISVLSFIILFGLSSIPQLINGLTFISTMKSFGVGNVMLISCDNDNDKEIYPVRKGILLVTWVINKTEHIDGRKDSGRTRLSIGLNGAGFDELVPISDKLNRTHAWKNFASGYKPNILSLTFGHGTGSYLNIVKNTIYFPTSGPHSLILQVLNRFGLFGFVLLGYFVLNYFLYLSKGFNRINTVIIFMLLTLFLSLEIKTDSIMLVDGTSVFLFYALNGIIAKSTYEKIKD